MTIQVPADVKSGLNIRTNDRARPLKSDLRRVAIGRAIAWHKGPSQNAQIHQNLYSSGDYSVVLAKPGKEASIVGPRNNPNDMKPIIVYRGAQLDYAPSFGDIFEDFHKLASSDVEEHRLVAVIIACLLVRSSNFYDHVEDLNQLDNLRQPIVIWKPPTQVLKYLLQLMPFIDAKYKKNSVNLPLDVYLYLIDALAYNEDVKYQHTFKKPKTTSGPGRKNTLSTVAHVVAVVLNRASFSELMEKASQNRGVAPMTNKKTYEIFGWLANQADIDFG